MYLNPVWKLLGVDMFSAVSKLRNMLRIHLMKFENIYTLKVLLFTYKLKNDKSNTTALLLNRTLKIDHSLTVYCKLIMYKYAGHIFPLLLTYIYVCLYSLTIIVFHVIYQTRATVFHLDIQTPRRELKIRSAAEYFCLNSRCLNIR